MSEEHVLVKSFLEDRDEQSFLAIYRRFTPQLYPLAVHLLHGSREEAEDVLQEFWIRAVRNLPQFRWESQLRTWLTSILIRCCSEQKRSHIRNGLIAAKDREHAGNPDDSASRIAIERAVSKLPDGQREVFLLHDVEGYTHEEIASLLRIEPGTSKSQLSHARKFLRSLLQG